MPLNSLLPLHPRSVSHSLHPVFLLWVTPSLPSLPSMQDPSKPALPSDFQWYHSEGNDKPMPESGVSFFAYSALMAIVDYLMVGPGRIQCSGWGAKMVDALQHEMADEHGNPMRCFMALATCQPQKSCQAKKWCIETTEVAITLDEDDCDYHDTEPVESKSSSPSESNSCHGPSNAEVSFLCVTVSILTYVLTYCTCRSLISYHLRWSPM